MTGISSTQIGGMQQQSINGVISYNPVLGHNAEAQGDLVLVNSTSGDINTKYVYLFNLAVNDIISYEAHLYNGATAKSIISRDLVVLESSAVRGNILSGGAIKVEKSTVTGSCQAPKIEAVKSKLNDCLSDREIKLTDCEASQVTSSGLVKIDCPNERRSYNVITADECEARNCNMKFLSASRIKATFSSIDNLHVSMKDSECTIYLSSTSVKDIIIYPSRGPFSLPLFFPLGNERFDAWLADRKSGECITVKEIKYYYLGNRLALPYYKVTIEGGRIPAQIKFMGCHGECDHTLDSRNQGAGNGS